MASTEYPKEFETQLIDESASFYADPLGWVLWAFDWGHGELEGWDGPDTWQRDWLTWLGDCIKDRGFDGRKPVMPIRSATASGHGIGKSALVAMVILFIMSTRAKAKGTVTANTSDQLRTKTWGEVAKWKRLCITGHWFEYNNSKGSMNLYHTRFPEDWRVDAVTCREENSEAFAGQHRADSTPFYIFDEASAVPDSIWEVAEGGLTDGEPMFFVFGNPTRNTGMFKQCFNDSRWARKQIDSRSARTPNHQLIKEWVGVHGEDSDFVRVRIRGMFPRASDMQFFPTELVSISMRRKLPRATGLDPLICGIDYSRGGDDKCVIQFRRGKDARSEKRYEIAGEKSRDSIKVAALVATVLERHRPNHIFGDVGSMGGPINDRLRQLGWRVTDVGFGEKAQDEEKYANRTGEMCYRLLEWLQAGGCLPFVPDLETDLTSREFTHDNKDRFAMESKKLMKKRIGRSPDDMDALMLTFAATVAPVLPATRDDRPLGLRGVSGEAYDPFSALEG